MRKPKFSQETKGLTLIEILIVVAIIAVLAGIAVPQIYRGRRQAQAAALTEEFRNNYDAFVMFAQDKGTLPPTSPDPGFGEVPQGMEMYMPKRSTWTIDNVSGSLTNPQFRGRWTWVRASGVYPPYNGFIMFYSPDITPEIAQDIDNRFDDGNITTGGLRYTAGSSDTGNVPWLWLGVQ